MRKLWVGNKMKLLFILYDGIQNSVFQGLVLTPLLKQLETNKDLHITIVSFEKTKPDKTIINEIQNKHAQLKLVLLRKLPYLGKLSLYFAIPQLKKVIKRINPNQIICRGPLSGFIALKVIKKKNMPVTIQARGLCAQEYRFATKSHGFIFRSLEKIEKFVYGNKNIESVSPALKQYLVQTFNANPNHITIAQKDIPKPIPKATRTEYKKEIRKKLGIPEHTSVYCYAGSAKPWQCVEESITFFAKKLAKNPNSFLLILSQDIKQIEQIMHKTHIPKQNYRILHVKANKLTKYLCACDYGFLFRKKDIINYVSRPTKMLEYQAANLEILHNETVAWLQQNPFHQKIHIDQS